MYVISDAATGWYVDENGDWTAELFYARHFMTQNDADAYIVRRGLQFVAVRRV